MSWGLTSYVLGLFNWAKQNITAIYQWISGAESEALKRQIEKLMLELQKAQNTAAREEQKVARLGADLALGKEKMKTLSDQVENLMVELDKRDHSFRHMAEKFRREAAMCQEEQRLRIELSRSVEMLQSDLEEGKSRKKHSELKVAELSANLVSREGEIKTLWDQLEFMMVENDKKEGSYRHMEEKFQKEAATCQEEQRKRIELNRTVIMLRLDLDQQKKQTELWIRKEGETRHELEELGEKYSKISQGNELMFQTGVIDSQNLQQELEAEKTAQAETSTEAKLENRREKRRRRRDKKKASHSKLVSAPAPDQELEIEEGSQDQDEGQTQDLEENRQKLNLERPPCCHDSTGLAQKKQK
ncbi:trichohyalin-like [Cheilinus undulatus]|uniref:trichohyalin-like n=1 Tax=Cheilinus undulatus TaxID=241271 RepID=UPI001BD2AFE8|nr:trichohyalin-like [Cheilinus undulatus]